MEKLTCDHGEDGLCDVCHEDYIARCEALLAEATAEHGQMLWEIGRRDWLPPSSDDEAPY